MFRIDTREFSQEVDLKTLAAGFLLSGAVLTGTISAAAAHHYDAPQYPMPAPDYGPAPGPTYNFYGPTTNYFGPASNAGVAPAAYYGPPVPYGDAPYYQPPLPPQQFYDDSRLDPWNGYDPYRGLENGY
jgi:hypothetical protein